MPAKVSMNVDGLDMDNIPQHVAIIMDGNGRWAKARGKIRTQGHKVGAETLKTIVRAADTLGIKAITAYAFSTENWKRPVTEVHFIMELLSRYLTSEIEEFKENNVQVRFMGSREGLPDIVIEKMDHAIEETKNDTGIILNLAINYGGQAEILHAVKSIAQQVADGPLLPLHIMHLLVVELTFKFSDEFVLRIDGEGIHGIEIATFGRVITDANAHEV